MLKALWTKLLAPPSRRQSTSFGDDDLPAKFTGQGRVLRGGRRGRGGALLRDDSGAPLKPPAGHRRRRALAGMRRRKVQVLVVGLLALSLIPVTLAGLENATRTATGEAVRSVRRLPNALPSGAQVARPARPTTGPAAQALNFLVIGTDDRDEEPNGIDPIKRPDEPGGRTDTIMLVHLPVDRRSAYVVSFPRDSWVTIPGQGTNKINAAYALGGSQLLVQTVETLTKTRVDHVVAVDFAGFVKLSDALGGVLVNTESGGKWLYGVEALNFVRARQNLLRGDLDRVQRQQAYLRALMNKVLESESFATPARLNELLATVADAVQTDDRLTQDQLRDLVISLRHMDGKDVRFLTAPVKGTGREQGVSVVHLDDELGATLWPAVREDRIDGWLATYKTDTLGNVVEDPIKRRRQARPTTPAPSSSPAASSRPRSSTTARAATPSSAPPSSKSTSRPSKSEDSR